MTDVRRMLVVLTAAMLVHAGAGGPVVCNQCQVQLRGICQGDTVCQDVGTPENNDCGYTCVCPPQTSGGCKSQLPSLPVVRETIFFKASPVDILDPALFELLKNIESNSLTTEPISFPTTTTATTTTTPTTSTTTSATTPTSKTSALPPVVPPLSGSDPQLLDIPENRTVGLSTSHTLQPSPGGQPSLPPTTASPVTPDAGPAPNETRPESPASAASGVPRRVVVDKVPLPTASSRLTLLNTSTSGGSTLRQRSQRQRQPGATTSEPVLSSAVDTAVTSEKQPSNVTSSTLNPTDVLLPTNTTLNITDVLLPTNATLNSTDVLLPTNATLNSTDVLLPTNATLNSTDVLLPTNATLNSTDVLLPTNATLENIVEEIVKFIFH